MTPAAELGDDDVARVVRSGYDAIAERYAEYAAAAMSHPRREWLEDLLSRLGPSSRVLELGCGPGVPIAARLSAEGHRLTGVDISGAQIDLARRNVPTATFVHADLLSMDFEPGSFEAVVAFYSIIHVPRRRYPELFSRIHTWLVPHGWLLGTFGTGDSAGWLEDDLMGFGAANWTNSYDTGTTEQLLLDAGFLTERVDTVVQDEPTGPESWLYVLARQIGQTQNSLPSGSVNTT